MTLAGKNQVVTRYKLSILGVFIAITFASLFLSSYRYYTELNSFENLELQGLITQSNAINQQLEKAANSVEAIQHFASYSLSFPNEITMKMPTFSQEGERYFLNKTRHDIIKQRQQLSVNITGIGDLKKKDPLLENELAMAHALTPAFMIAQKANESANWFYYISKKRFVSIFPWINKTNWQYSDVLNESDFIQKTRKADYYSQQTFWSEPYIAASGNSLFSAVGSAVFRKEEYVGTVMANIDLARLHKQIAITEGKNYHYIMVDAAGKVLLHRTQDAPALKDELLWSDIMPDELKGITSNTLEGSPPSFHYQSWLVQKSTLPVTGWTLVKYQPYDAFSAPIFNRFMWLFFLLFLGQLALLAVVYVVTSKTFIKPTQEFINHIAYSAKGDHGKIQPPKGWLHWFNIVGDIFSQNRSLMQQLKDQNSILDIRVNEKTQALLEKSEQHQHDYAILRSVMDAIPDYLIFNDPKGELIGCNLAFEVFIGKKEKSILGTQAGALIPNELGKSLLSTQNDSKTLNEHGLFKVIETVENTYELFTSDFYNQEKQVLGSIVIIRDVTSQYAINAALAAAKEQAELANQTKSQFLANMSHEIRTPINAIQGMQSLLEKTSLTNQQFNHLANAQSASDALLHLVDELLDLAKIESGNMSIIKEECRLDNIVNQAINLNIGKAKDKGLTLNVCIEADVPVLVFIDEMRLVQVLSNLLNNAIKFTHQGGVTILIAAIASSEADTLVRFSVKDTGIGIAKNKQGHLFEAFMQADESMTREYGGSGLGLSICQRIINLLGGEIKLVSDIGQGTEFNFVLPLKTNNDDALSELAVDVQTFTITYPLPTDFKKLIDAYGFKYHCLSSIKALANHPKTDVNILFMGIEEVNESICRMLSEELCQLLPDNTRPENCILAICLSSSSEDYNAHFELLAQYKLPYIVCSSPLYRYDLLKLVDAASNERLSKQNSLMGQKIEEQITEEAPRNLAQVNILLVEDNLVNQLVAKELLKNMQAEVTVVDNGQLAINCLEEQTFDVILMDIQMPVMDGLTATKLIREDERYKDLPIIAMTAHARQEDKDNSFSAGMNLHIAKPVKAEVLLNSILDVLATPAN
ncbi:ATP-binding protein [Colwelliaceae bacterium 6441]